MPRAATQAETSRIQIRLLGEPEVIVNGRPHALPQSKKTRALLGYLVLNPRSHRRDRLCALLWDVADDPRAALRWSLSKLRELVDAPRKPRLLADREHVSIELTGAEVDVLEVRRLIAGSPEQASTAHLEAARALFRGELLEGLELPDFHAYSAWCAAERQTWRELHRRIVMTLLARSAGDPGKSLELARELVQLDPSDERARTHLLELLRSAGRTHEAEQQQRATQRLLAEPAARAAEPERRVAPEVAAEPGARRADGHDALPFVGREAERARLRAWLGESRQELRVLLIEGDAGVGKSRLLRELTSAAELGSARIVRASVPEARPGWPYAPFRQLLRALVSTLADGALRETLAPLLPEGGALPQAAAGRDPLFRAVQACIELSARERPLVIMIDDVHWLDEASAELLHFVALGVRAARVDVLLTARGGELPDQPGIARVLRALRREGLLQELRLAPLTRDQTLELVAPLLSRELAARIYEQSAGNPLFAIELARESPAGTALPGSISRLVRDRIDALPPEQADVLRWAAVLGERFDRELLAQVCALELEVLVATLERLERHGWLELEPALGEREGTSSFSHEIVQRTVYDQLSEPRRRLMHTRIARALAGEVDVDGARAAAIAHHAVLGGDRAMAARACLSAGQRCLRLYAHADAANLARHGLAHAGELSDPDRTTLSLELLDLGIHARRPSSVDEALAQLVELTSRALALGAIDHARIGFYLRAFLTWERGQVADAHRFSREVERISRLSNPGERVLALADAAYCLAVLERDLPEAEAYLLEAEAVAGEGSDQCLLPLARGILSVQRGEYARAERELERGGQLALRAGNRFEEFRALEFRVGLELARQDYAAALPLATDLQPLAERLRGGSEAPYARALLSLVRYGVGLDQTAEAFDRALQELVLADAKQRCAHLLSHAALIEQSRADWAPAAAHAREALRLAEIMERHSEAALALTVLAAAEAASDGRASAARLEALQAQLVHPIAAHARRAVESTLAASPSRTEEKPHGPRHRRANLR